MNSTLNKEIPRVELQVSNSAFSRRIRQFDLVNNGFKHIDQFLLSAFGLYESQIHEAITQFDMIKTLSYFSAEFERLFKNETDRDPLLEKRTIDIPTRMREINSSTDVSEHFQSD